MDVRVRHKKTGEIQEMSDYMFSLLNQDFELAMPEPNKRPVIEEPKVEAPRETLKAHEEKKETEILIEPIAYQPIVTNEIDYVKKYEELFGKKPHGRMKPETIKEAVEETLKEKSFEVQSEPGE